MAMQDDERCCGTGTCIIDTHGLCWCGQQWEILAANLQVCTATEKESALDESFIADDAHSHFETHH
jgi:hypothetical protein